MNIRDLHYLVTLAQTGHFKKASELCFVSQPTLSLQIKKLENDLGISLIERGGRFIKPTTEGQVIIEKAKTILQQVDEIKESARYLKDPLSGSFRLAIFPTLSPYLLPHITPLIRNELPNVSLKLFEYTTDKCIELLTDGDLDAILIAESLPAASIESEFLFEENFVFACSNTHPLGSADSVSPEMINRDEFLLLQEGHCLRNHVTEFCGMASRPSRFDYSATSLDTLIAMVSLNEGVTLLPSLAITHQDNASIKVKAFNNPSPSRPIYINWKKQSSKKNITRLLSSIVKKSISSFQGIEIEKSHVS